MNLLLVALGGAAGALLRHGSGMAVRQMLGTHFPWTTLLVNLVGSFLIGLVWSLAEAKVLSFELKLLVVTGFLGAFTTFSTFSLENLNLIRDGAWRLAVLNMLISVFCGLLLAYAGYALARFIR